MTQTETIAPIPMLLFCPMCNSRHIDDGDFATKPHHTHACQNMKCGMVWRPAIVPTVGVQWLPGFNNAINKLDAWRDQQEPPKAPLVLQMSAVHVELDNERKAQIRQWGGKDHDDEHAMNDWLAFIKKQLTRARKNEHYRDALVKIGALSIAAIESTDRKWPR